MRMSNAGIDMLKKFEGLRLHAYKDSGGKPTIGYGHTKNVEMDDVITEQQAEAFLKEDVSEAEIAVERNVPYGLAPHQFDALVSLVYNIGIGAFEKSTLLQMLKESKILEASNEFLRWKYVGRKLSNGLLNRRIKERTVFLTGTY